VNSALFIAQGFGVGRIPFAPGTFGSVLGVAWFALLLAGGKVWVLLLGTFAGLALSVWLCGAAEKKLGQKDPGSVVLDEITAMPICFYSWVGIFLRKTGTLPGLDQLVSSGHWLTTLGVFAAFRFFDIVKPAPVRQSQALPGGWGVTVDDVLAAIYVSLVVWVVDIGKGLVLK
jgi:phosphatidylglycerophosphatase A